ncbi:MAG: D-alanyl-D-alanine carboxypeptidase family protein [Clostridium sp.]
MKRRFFCFLLCFLLTTGIFPSTALASTDWPSDISINSDAGIIMDAHSGAVIYGKNIHSAFSPASITKVLTALIILENCPLDDIVTFSQNAVYNVESNSSSAGYDTGDQATVKDCIYALLLKSANESANALAEHLDGSTEAFAERMNAEAAKLGCQDSHFTNPSGLNDENHYVSAYDMALITRAAFNNKLFSDIVSTTYYELPPNKTNPEGQGISPGNKMVKPNWPAHYRSDVIGGKTGYTSIALNTLVICAEQGDTKFVTVILHSQATQYEDTKKLLDFGFQNFQSVRIGDYDKTYSSIGDDLKIAGLPTSEKPILNIDTDSCIILPKTADFSETSTTLDYVLPENAPKGAIARISYKLGDRPIGQAYLTLSAPLAESDTPLPDALLEITPTAIAAVSDNSDGTKTIDESTAVPAPTEEAEHPNFKISLNIPPLFWKVLIGILVIAALIGGTTVYIIGYRRKEHRDRMQRRRRRIDRLKETGLSEADFDLMIQKRRSNPKNKKTRRD